MQDVIEFLRQLRLHNDRTWFEANKSWYRDAQSQFAAFVEELIAGIAIVLVHCWKKNTLLSVGGGTLFYMFLVQIIFK